VADVCVPKLGDIGCESQASCRLGTQRADPAVQQRHMQKAVEARNTNGQ
jgi:hypothetical protein